MTDPAHPSLDTLTFRDAREADVPTLAAMLRDDPIGSAREGEPDDPAYLAAFRAIEAQQGNRLIVAEAGHGAVVGCLQLILMPGLSHRGGVRAELENVRVALSHRSRGVGAKMVAHAIGIAKAEGARLVQLTSDLARPDAHRFWMAQGFARSHAGFKLKL
ncbi:MAG: GNAT family N-acetyltransferase [Pseudomonadota bacterium]|nr:GNAT family N-acetyltransferase [Pseudomonadota bacterium]MEE3100162.1 GNAT family N-acetyltransferase [Pseudomonadota bacterium]